MTQQLFGYVEIESEERWDRDCRNRSLPEMVGLHEDIMPSHLDGRPISGFCAKLFYLE